MASEDADEGVVSRPAAGRVVCWVEGVGRNKVSSLSARDPRWRTYVYGAAGFHESLASRRGASSVDYCDNRWPDSDKSSEQTNESDGCNGSPERLDGSEGDKVRAGAAAQVTGAARDERSVAAVTHCQFVVGYGVG